MNLQNGEYTLLSIPEHTLKYIYQGSVNATIFSKEKVDVHNIYLTNRAIVYEVKRKNQRGKKEIFECRKSLSEIKFVDGQPQVFASESIDDRDYWLLQLIFNNDGITFLIHCSDGRKKGKQRRELWLNEIYKVLVGKPYSVDIMNENSLISSTQVGVKRGAEIGKTVAEAAKVVPIVGNIASKVIGLGTGLVGGALGGIASAISGITSKKNDSNANEIYANPVINESSKLQQIKCIGCHFILSGYVGDKVCCPYCDTEQII